MLGHQETVKEREGGSDPDRKGRSYQPSPGTVQERTMSQLYNNC
jgi:hypothetical protein